MQLRDLIDEAITTAGSERKLAKAIGTFGPQINAWKHGNRPCPDEYIVRMARLVGRNPMATAVEVYKERLGELVRTLAIGAVAMLFTFGANDHALAAAGGHEPMRDDV
jgi:hypothetical protein